MIEQSITDSTKYFSTNIFLDFLTLHASNKVFFVGFPNIPNLDPSKYFLYWIASLIRKSHVDISTDWQEGVNN